MAKKYILKKDSSIQEIQKVEKNFLINYHNELNPAQYEAVSAVEGAYLVIAGAGSGKTRTLVYRVARLIELGYDPSSILLLTFTRKAAKEMMDRASILLDNRCSKINGGTFHSFANLTLRKYAKAVNLDNGFTILDQSDSEDVINLIRSQLKISQLKKRFPNKSTIYNVISLSVNTGRSIESILEDDLPHFVEYTNKIIDINKVYQSYKRKNNLLDYDDLLIYLKYFLFENSTATKSFLNTINFVMVDEYQDTNKIQAEIIQGLAQRNNNVMVVGDDSQSIYSFRGANFKNIMEFPKLFSNVKIIKLEENYRSTQEILNFANHIIEQAVEKYPKFLFTKKIGGELPGIVSAANQNMQSRFITERILELREEGIPLNEIAVLFRSSFHSFDLEIELNKANIPYQKFGGMKFIETAHIKDVLAFLRIAANPNDFVSWYRVLLLHDGIGPKKAQQIIDAINLGKFSISVHPEKMLTKNIDDRIFNLFNLLHEINTKNILPSDKAELVINYYEPIFTTKYDDYNKRKKDLEIFINIAEKYKSLESFLTDMALDPPQDSVTDVEAIDKEKEILTLSTIHSAKGLEWHTVFIIHAADGFFPSSQSFEKLETLEEERRLMYVASTRAKQNLYVCYPMQIFDRYQGFTFAKPSRFIEGIDEQMAEVWLLEEE
ncbi:MAG: ATP-dependent helicase [Melioribacteraceae bacterium]|nr:ATP-dependent helicase [Melioribacteraceae bacterium]